MGTKYYGKQKNEKRKVTDVWPNYLKGGYFNENGNLRNEYLNKEQVEPLVKKMAHSKPMLTMHQLRRFFQHARIIEAKLKAHMSTWDEQRPEFQKLLIAAADAHGKKNTKIPALFYDFIERNSANVESEKDFTFGFLPHFEALVGFGSLHLREKERS